MDLLLILWNTRLQSCRVVDARCAVRFSLSV